MWFVLENDSNKMGQTCILTPALGFSLEMDGSKTILLIIVYEFSYSLLPSLPFSLPPSPFISFFLTGSQCTIPAVLESAI